MRKTATEIKELVTKLTNAKKRQTVTMPETRRVLMNKSKEQLVSIILSLTTVLFMRKG